jgi:hypothetical protein
VPKWPEEPALVLRFWRSSRHRFVPTQTEALRTFPKVIAVQCHGGHEIAWAISEICEVGKDPKKFETEAATGAEPEA